MLTKRLLAGVLAFVLCFALVACNNTPPADSTTESTAPSTSDAEGTTSESTSTSNSTTESSSTSGITYQTLPTQNPVPTYPDLTASSDDLESVKVGKYVTLRYNANAVDVTYEAKKGVGSKESVTVSETDSVSVSATGPVCGSVAAGTLQEVMEKIKEIQAKRRNHVMKL
jgi:hypothetical protein